MAGLGKSRLEEGHPGPSLARLLRSSIPEHGKENHYTAAGEPHQTRRLPAAHPPEATARPSHLITAFGTSGTASPAPKDAKVPRGRSHSRNHTCPWGRGGRWAGEQQPGKGLSDVSQGECAIPDRNRRPPREIKRRKHKNKSRLMGTNRLGFLLPLWRELQD